MAATVDPGRMSPEERLAEVAAILARGVLRLHTRAATGGEKSVDSGQKTLDSGRETSSHVSAVSTRRQAEKGGRDA